MAVKKKPASAPQIRRDPNVLSAGFLPGETQEQAIAEPRRVASLVEHARA